MQNMGFDPDFQVSQIELLGHDSAGGVLRRVQVDSSGNLKIDPTGLDSRYFKLDQSTPQTITGIIQNSSYYSGGGGMLINAPYGMYLTNRERGAYGFKSSVETGGARQLLISSGDGATYTGGNIKLSVDGTDILSVGSSITSVANLLIQKTTATLTLQTDDASYPTLRFKTTNQAHQVDIWTQEVTNYDYINTSASANHLQSQFISPAGKQASMIVKSGGGNGYGYFRHLPSASGGHVVFGNLKQDGDLQFQVNDGGSTTTPLTIVGATSSVQLAEASNFIFGTTTGTQIGTATDQKIGFYGTAPVVQQVLATGGGATVDDVIGFLQTIGLCKQS
jgi:hypothetical protein